MKKIAKYMLTTGVAAALTGCAHEGSDPDITPVTYSLVTYTGMSQGEPPVATFEYQVRDDSPTIYYTANMAEPAGFKAPERVIIAYKTDTPGQSGPIEVTGIGKVHNGECQELPPDGAPSSQGITVNSLWRSGAYINLNASAYFSGPASDIALYVDHETLSRTEVQAYIIVMPQYDTLQDGPARQLYASWDASWLRQIDTIETLRVNYTDFSGRQRSVAIKMR